VAGVHYVVVALNRQTPWICRGAVGQREYGERRKQHIHEKGCTMATPTDRSTKLAADLRTAGFRGPIVTSDHPDYDATRALYNAMIDRRPGVIARCVDDADVQAVVRTTADADVDLAVRSGGHNGAGLGSVDDGIVADLSPMTGIRVDRDATTVRVQPGCTWGDVDHATHAYGRATPSGIVSTTGVSGLTLGGGHGHLTRRDGLTIDNLLSADVVLADGSRVTADDEHHNDLFWALRGGGGNFGVVTSFEFRLNPVHTVIGGPTLWRLDQAPDVMAWYRDFIRQAPRELNGFFAFLTVPPAPPFPPSLHLEKMCGVVWCYTGDPDTADDVFEPVRMMGPPALYGIQPMPYPMLQSAFDGLYPPGHQWYWRGDFVRDIPDEAIARHVEYATQMPTMQSGMHLYPIDGAAADVPTDATAWNHRDANWSMVIAGVDPDPANAGALRDWSVGYWEALHPYSAGGAYVNFLGQGEGPDRVHAAYGANYDRLAQVKATYDPTNLFHINQNIPPATT
jgi:FAD/FMN-containing dehydrogenase